MAWTDVLKGDSLSWLLEEKDIGVRYLALRDLMKAPENSPEFDAARQKAHTQGPIATILENMHPDGYWSEPGPGYNPKYFSTIWSINLLAQLGASVNEDERISTACRYFLDQAMAEGGQISASGAPSGTADCMQGNILWSLLSLGFEDARLEKIIDWTARSVTGEGIAVMGEKNATQRYYAGKCGPTFACGANNKLPCAWGGAKVMLALGKLDPSRRTPEVEKAIQHGLDFFFSRELTEASYPSGWTDKPSSNWWKFGFPVFYVTDLLQVAEALTSLGYSNDPRMEALTKLICDKQDENGRWLLEYEYNGKTWVEFGEKKKPNKWVTLRALRVLKQT